MEHRTKRNHHLRELISDYEAMCENGHMAYLEEKTFFQLIQYYEDDFRLDKALEAANIALEQHCYCADLLIVKARLLLLKDRPYLALKYLDKAEAISPSELDIILLRAKIFNDIGEFDQAICILNEAQKFCLGYDLIELYISEALIYENMHDYNKMFTALSQVLKLDPQNEEALEHMWLSVEHSKKYRESIQLHRKLLDVDAYSHLAWFNLGHAYACQGEYNMAIEALEFSFLIDSDFEQGYQDCAEICIQVKDYKKALFIYQEISTRFGEECEILVKIAECYLNLDHVSEAKNVLIHALKMDPYDDEVYYNLAQCFLREKKFENAISALIKATDIENRREEYFADLAQAYLELKNFKKANFYFKKATEVGPEQECYWSQHASFLIQLKKYSKALEVLDESEFHTVGPELSYCRAICLLSLGKRKKGLKILDEALSEEFKRHNLLFKLAPELTHDKDVLSMLNYYKGERVNSLY